MGACGGSFPAFGAYVAQWHGRCMAPPCKAAAAFALACLSLPLSLSLSLSLCRMDWPPYPSSPYLAPRVPCLAPPPPHIHPLRAHQSSSNCATVSTLCMALLGAMLLGECSLPKRRTVQPAFPHSLHLHGKRSLHLHLLASLSLSLSLSVAWIGPHIHPTHIWHPASPVLAPRIHPLRGVATSVFILRQCKHTMHGAVGKHDCICLHTPAVQMPAYASMWLQRSRLRIAPTVQPARSNVLLQDS